MTARPLELDGAPGVWLDPIAAASVSRVVDRALDTLRHDFGTAALAAVSPDLLHAARVLRSAGAR